MTPGSGPRRTCAPTPPRCAAARAVPGGDQQQGGGVRADAVEAEQARREGGDERDDEVIQPPDLGIEELHSPASSRSATRTAMRSMIGAASNCPPNSSSISCKFPGEACFVIFQFIRPVFSHTSILLPRRKRASRRKFLKTVVDMVTEGRPEESCLPSCRRTEVVL